MDREETQIIPEDSNFNETSKNDPKGHKIKSKLGVAGSAVAGAAVGGASAFASSKKETVEDIENEAQENKDPEPEEKNINKESNNSAKKVTQESKPDEEVTESKEDTTAEIKNEEEGSQNGTEDNDERDLKNEEESQSNEEIKLGEKESLSEFGLNEDETKNEKEDERESKEDLIEDSKEETKNTEETAQPINYDSQRSEPSFINTVFSEGEGDEEIRILGVETGTGAENQKIDVALVGNDSESVMVFDINQDSIIDLVIHDTNGDGYIQSDEIKNVSSENINMNDFVDKYSDSPQHNDEEPVSHVNMEPGNGQEEPPIITVNFEEEYTFEKEPIETIDPFEEETEIEPSTTEDNSSESYLAEDSMSPDDYPDFMNDADLTMEA